MEDPTLIRHFTRIRAATLGYLRVLVRDPHLAEDLFQETSLVVLQKLSTFDNSRDFEAWVRGIGRNLARNELRKRQGQNSMPSDQLAEAIERAHAGNSSESEHWASELEYLSSCMARIPPHHRKMVELRYRFGASLREIAKRLSRPQASIQVTLSRVRQALLNCIHRQRELAHHEA